MTRSLPIALATLALATAAPAQPSPQEAAVRARQSHMTLYAFNLGTLGGMAQGAIPYDAAQARTAASNLSAMAQLDQRGYWLEGTSSEDYEDSRALPAIWANMDDFWTKHGALQEATGALQAAAGTDLDSLRTALGSVGAACGGCHEVYRASDD